jgi:uncharacterized protein (TIGR02594 family)
MAYELTRLTAIRATPAKDGEKFDVLGSGTVLLGTGKRATDDTPAEWVNILIPPGFGDGWIPMANCKEVDDPPAPPLDPEGFVRQCTLADRLINSDASTAPFFATADFVIARALFETGMANGVFQSPEHNGPFRMTQAEWDAFMNSNHPAKEGMKTTDIRYSTMQVIAAAYRMSSDGRQISAASPASAGGDPFVPSYLDLFLCYLTDVPTLMTLKSMEANAAKTLGDVLSADQLASIQRRAQFSAIKPTTTVPAFFKEAEDVLAGLLDTAFQKHQTFAADELPKDATAVTGAWFGVAQAEMAAKVSEASTPDRIRAYFAATDFGKVTGQIPHWCGAFVAHCIKAAGAGDTIPKESARAANWTSWGTQSIPVGSDDLPQGAVVVLTPQPGTNTSGHVAFFSKFSADGKKVVLLGGNQSEAVNETGYSVTRIAAIRTLSTMAAIGAANRYDMTAAGVPKKFQQFGDMIVDRFQRAGFTKEQQIVAALANAIAESGLDPSIKAAGSEESYGLFQCNRKAGLGIGYTVEQLKNPDINISIIIKEARKHSKFTSASTVEAAVDAFVRFVERPKDTTGAIRKRIGIARLLM